MIRFNELQDKVKIIGRVIGLPEEYLLISDKETSSGQPYIKIDKEYQYINSERGYVISKQGTNDLDELLYWVFEDITSKYSVKYELDNRQEGVDSRRLKFKNQIELMAMWSDSWKTKTKTKIEDTLESSPYVDEGSMPRSKGILSWLRCYLK